MRPRVLQNDGIRECLLCNFVLQRSSQSCTLCVMSDNIHTYWRDWTWVANTGSKAEQSRNMAASAASVSHLTKVVSPHVPNAEDAPTPARTSCVVASATELHRLPPG